MESEYKNICINISLLNEAGQLEASDVSVIEKGLNQQQAIERQSVTAAAA